MKLNILGATIKKARLSKNLTQVSLGSILDVDCTFISKIENGHYKPARDFLKRISNALDLDFSLLVDLAGQMTPEQLKDLKKYQDIVAENAALKQQIAETKSLLLQSNREKDEALVLLNSIASNLIAITDRIKDGQK
ncbi:MAG: helix-turn-helix transcriptional regulator [Oscillatoria sp. SIO1A7]|nr:helix-turn-helix transcriptional regulator [Oscillatoria sp. SIO1A7]